MILRAVLLTGFPELYSRCKERNTYVGCGIGCGHIQGPDIRGHVVVGCHTRGRQDESEVFASCMEDSSSS